MAITRRNLFKGAAVAGAMPLFNIGCANFGLSRNRQIAKGDKIRVALIGCGLQTHAMIDGVLCENLVAIVDPDSEEKDAAEETSNEAAAETAQEEPVPAETAESETPAEEAEQE